MSFYERELNKFIDHLEPGTPEERERAKQMFDESLGATIAKAQDGFAAGWVEFQKNHPGVAPFPNNLLDALARRLQ
jgi:hypothetical protein